MSDTYRCEYCGKTRHQLNPGACPVCHDNPNYVSVLFGKIEELTKKNNILKNRLKKMKEVKK